MKILSVTELSNQIKNLLEGNFPYVLVKGEITNLAKPASGHIYFSLRDGKNLLNCVWFRGSQARGQASFDPFTGEVFEQGENPALVMVNQMRDGDTFICCGTISSYPDRGQYQLRVITVQADGEGNLLRQLEILKRKLATKGVFDQSRKRPIPKNPTDIFIITAATGAAIRDFLKIANHNAIATRIRILPVPVQGDDAPARIITALSCANADNTAQVIVIIRGGGSLEDLWAFNSEELTEAVASSRLPVLTGIGHEVDTSLCDLASDMRAATPTHAAQILWQEREVTEQYIDDLQNSLKKFTMQRIALCEQRVLQLERLLINLSPAMRIKYNQEQLNSLIRRLNLAIDGKIKQAEEQLANLIRRMLTFTKSKLFSNQEKLLEDLVRRIDLNINMIFERNALKLQTLSSRLEGLNPNTPLKRGYAMVFGKDGRVLQSISDVPIGGIISVSLTDGNIGARVETKEKLCNV